MRKSKFSETQIVEILKNAYADLALEIAAGPSLPSRRVVRVVRPLPDAVALTEWRPIR